MPKLVPVTRQLHGSKSWQRFANYRFAANQAIIPIVGAEVPAAAVSLPLAFIRQADRYQLVAALSLRPGHNLFVDAASGQWLGNYIPAAFRGHPFQFVRLEGMDKPVLCIDEESGLVGDDAGGEPFFDAEGNPGPALKAVASFLEKVDGAQHVTDLVAASLADAGVLVSWDITIGNSDGHIQRVEGLYCVDEVALNNLSGESFLKVRATGGLPLAYGQLLSMQHLQVLRHLASARLTAAAAMSKLPVSPTGELDLEFLNTDPPMDFSRLK